MANRTYGSAVLTALQAQHKSIDEIENLIMKRRIQIFLDGGDIHEWLDCFWHTIALMEVQRCRKKIEDRNLQTIFSINVRICKSVTVIVLK